MEPFRKTQMREQLKKMIGGNPAGDQMIELILKANFEGFSEQEVEAYKKQKEDEIAYFRERLDIGTSQPVESVVVENQNLLSIDNVVDEPTGIKTIGDNNDQL